MKFEWDATKAARNFLDRGIRFERASAVFNDPGAVIRQDTRRDYGEERFEITGFIQERLFVVIFTLREGRVRIISARKANARERKRHGNRSDDN
ncbi:MAG: BrnT family toxin [Ahrensia sp.]|nr:BrnT family toxin [Ahrensia sp.]